MYIYIYRDKYIPNTVDFLSIAQDKQNYKIKVLPRANQSVG